MMKQLARAAARQLGYHVSRGQRNRFDAMTETLQFLARQGYQPRVVIDVGSNVGQWHKMVHAVFPNADYHLVEPQVNCHAAIREIMRQNPKVHLHPFAASRPGVTSVSMTGAGSTGMWVMPADASAENHPVDATPDATTIDSMFAAKITRADRALLKLDIEGHELVALSGADAVLTLAEVLLLEVTFYDVGHSGRPLFGEVSAFLAERGFQFYDFAALFPRTRDGRLRMGDAFFVRLDSPLLADNSWE